MRIAAVVERASAQNGVPPPVPQGILRPKEGRAQEEVSPFAPQCGRQRWVARRRKVAAQAPHLSARPGVALPGTRTKGNAWNCWTLPWHHHRQT